MLTILFFGSFVLALILHVAALWLFPKLGLLDFPERYGHLRSRVPYPTGIVCVLLFLGLVFCIITPDKQLWGILLGIAVLGVTCFLDDRYRLSPLLRLCLQIVTAVLIFGLGTRIYSLTNPLVADGIVKLDTWVIPFALFNDPPVWSGFFTIGWLVLTINALNWFDGIPGQASSMSAIGFFTLAMLALYPRGVVMDAGQQLELAQIGLLLAGIAAGSFFFEVPKVRVVPGDTGTMFFGLMLGVLTIFSGGKVATAFLVLGIPLIDSGIVIVRRVLKKKSPFHGSQRDEHLHHRLLQCGWKQWQILLLFASTGTAFGITALYLSTLQKFIAAGVLLICMLLLSWYTEHACQRSSSKLSSTYQ